ncbi:hypothetical protein VTN96DRAFT_4678 [Rasamsonia emersonii]|uniref:Monooxygenase n=1 Tax=Rasamsonia emersonii (strain ATCC 16479 / CBS 393.64 / IMI 116815) TaxID=1408163 RepID=A0A0F4YDR6_RASE3|nr:Monooxygenase [Rasamsonia emersonii CBS 393.64]KKA16342.1 Monooxygenase [Rasamsonia emersonii CBS 393.64]
MSADEIDTKASVIVIGAGPVGLLVGLRLVRAGIPTTVLEMLPAVENSPRAAVYMPVAVRELDRAGILDECRSIGTSGTKLAWRKINGEVIVELDRIPNEEEPYENLILGQHELAEVIQRAFQQENSAEETLARVLFSHRAVKIEQDEEGVTVTAEVGEEKREHRFRAQYVVGADGARSFVRRHLNIPFEGFTWDRQIVATNVVYPFDKYGYTTGNNIVHPDHFAVIAKLNNQGLWRVSYGEERNLTTEQLRERLKMKYEALFPGPRPLKYDLKMFSPYRIHQRCSTTFRVGRVLLAGDAAHVCNPFGGLGLTGGLLDAGALSDCLIAVLNNDVPDTVLDKYAELRRDIFLKVVDPTTQANIRRLFENDSETCRETDPFFRTLATASSSERQKIRGMQNLAVDMKGVIEAAKDRKRRDDVDRRTRKSAAL